MEDRAETVSASGLRRLLACPECTLQYDVTDLEVGSRFRCSCGQLMAVPHFQPEDAGVVRCSSCGGPRLKGSTTCSFCKADFTLHERHLHTVCPACFTRIADQARFCHHCGVAIVPQVAAGKATTYSCPSCSGEAPLSSRKLPESEVAFLECRCCGGIWVGHELFGHLQEKALREEVPRHRRPDRKEVQGSQSIASTRSYRQCPVCHKQMSRRNFERRSGVILDMCPSHGVWLDMGELDAILSWIRDGGLSRAKAAEAQRARAPKAFHRPLDRLQQGGSLFDESDSEGKVGGDFMRVLIDFFAS